MVDGNSIGHFLFCSHPSSSRGKNHLHYYIEFIPLVNDIQAGTTTHRLSKSKSGMESTRRYAAPVAKPSYSFRYSVTDVTEASLYRYMFSYKAIRLQVNSSQEFIFCFDDKQTAEAVLEKLRDN